MISAPKTVRPLRAESRGVSPAPPPRSHRHAPRSSRFQSSTRPEPSLRNELDSVGSLGTEYDDRSGKRIMPKRLSHQRYETIAPLRKSIRLIAISTRIPPPSIS